MTSERASRRAIAGVAAPLFVASAAATIHWCRSMEATGGMPMPGGWTLSMTWMRMPGQSWPAAAASFTGMWAVMMVAMMLPSLVPVLWRYHVSGDGAVGVRRGWRTALVSAGYFLVWAIIGAAVFPLGAAMAAIAMRAPALASLVPSAVGLVVLIAGSVQLTAWKSRHLACWRQTSSHGGAATAGAALRHGVRLGLRCGMHGSGAMAILLVAGIMDLRAMAVVTAALTAERLAPAGERVARGTGLVAVGVGMFLLVRLATGTAGR
jgi:predicted metal-binding membrane protein